MTKNDLPSGADVHGRFLRCDRCKTKFSADAQDYAGKSNDELTCCGVALRIARMVGRA